MHSELALILLLGQRRIFVYKLTLFGNLLVAVWTSWLKFVEYILAVVIDFVATTSLNHFATGKSRRCEP